MSSEKKILELTETEAVQAMAVPAIGAPLAVNPDTSAAQAVDDIHPVDAVRAVVSGKGVTLKQLIDSFFADYRAGRWKAYKRNTDNSTKKDLPRLTEYFGEDRDIATIDETEAAAYMDSVSFGYTRHKTPKSMTEAGALSIYYSNRRVFDYGVNKGWIDHNVFRTMDPMAIPYVDRENKPGVRVDEAQVRKIAQAMLQQDSDFVSVRSVLFILLAYGSHIRPGDLLVLTWPELDRMVEAGEVSEWVERLLKTYRSAQTEWLKRNHINNNEGFVFVNGNSDNGVARPAAPGSAGGWLKEKILEPQQLPRVTINVLSSRTLTPQTAFDGLDPDGDWPIFGTVKFIEASFGHTGMSPEEKARRIAGRKARRAEKSVLNSNGGK